MIRSRRVTKREQLGDFIFKLKSAALRPITFAGFESYRSVKSIENKQHFQKKRHKGVIAATGRPLCNAAGHCDRWLHTHHQVTVFAGFDYFRPNMM